MSFRPPKGTFDVVPGKSDPVTSSAMWRSVLEEWERWTERYGYPLVMTPIFEATELFERGVGETSEVVNKQMYTFDDRGGRSMTLRPEGTAPVVRAYLDSGAQGAWKGAYSGPMFRYERPQKGRYRQFWQLGVEYLDVDAPLADAEVIELGYHFLSAVGVPGLEVRLNSIGDQKCRPAYQEKLRAYLNDRSDQLCDDSRALVDTNPLRVLDCKVCGPKLEDAPAIVDFLCEDCATHFDVVKSALDNLGIPYTLDKNLVRGLDYYTRTAFEYIATELDAAQNAVGGGGRYDGLAESIGGRSAPGVGFALGLDRIIITLGERVASDIDAYLVSETRPEEAIVAASALRAAGIRTDLDVQGRSVKAQFRAATRSGAPITLVLREGGRRVEARVGDSRVELEVEDAAGWVREWIDENTQSR